MKNTFIVLCLCALMVACQKKASTNENAKIEVTYEAERTHFFNSLKEPAEVAAQLAATGAEFNPGLLSNPVDFAGYTTNEVKSAANLGIYLADLNYAVAYNQSASTRELFTAANELSKVIGIEQDILAFLMVRYSENIAKNDSVKNIVNELFEKSTTGLQGTDRERLVGIAIAAYQIENLHLILGIIESYPHDMLPDDARAAVLAPAFKLALGQQETIEAIYAFLSAIADPLNPDQNPNYPYYANAFEELIGVYQKLDVEDKIANNQGIELMNDAVVQELQQKVKAIRTKIME